MTAAVAEQPTRGRHRPTGGENPGVRLRLDISEWWWFTRFCKIHPAKARMILGFSERRTDRYEKVLRTAPLTLEAYIAEYASGLDDLDDVTVTTITAE